MKNFVVASAAFAASITGAVADLCSNGQSQDAQGNYYCQAVSAVTYTGAKGSGSYQQVTGWDWHFDNNAGTCDQSSQSYSDSPLHDEVMKQSGS